MKDPLCDRFGLSATELRSFRFWAPAADYLINSEFSLNWRLVRNRLPKNDIAFRWGLADLHDSRRYDLG